MPDLKWILPKPNKEAVDELRQCGYSRVIAALLSRRGVSNGAQAREFLSIDGEFHDPLKLKGMEKAVERIKSALSAGEQITVYGDYDADGVTATSLLYTYLLSKGATADYYIPEREGEGYGLNASALKKIAESGTRLVITVDTGISAFSEAETARQLGLDLIITDHHEPRETIPDACAVINPKQPGCGYPFKELAGVGVAFKLVCALDSDSPGRLFHKYGSLVCLGTVADIVPLTGENRFIVSKGLDLVAAGSGCGINALLEAAGVKGKRLSSGLLSFTAAPRINAAGRMASAETALRMLISENPAEAAALAQQLNEYNTMRRTLEASIFQNAMEEINGNEALRNSPVLIFSGSNLNTGVIGIVASRLVDCYGKPAIVVSFNGDVGRASCRSIPGFNIHKALCQCARYLERFGGHELAAGFTITRENYDAFYAAVNRCANSLPELPMLAVEPDCKLHPNEISLSTARDLKKLEPCGSGNETPLFYIPDSQITGITPVGATHLRLTLVCGGFEFSAMLFGGRSTGFSFSENDIVDLAVNLDVHVYKNTEYLSVVIRHIRTSTSFDYYESLYGSFKAGGPNPELAERLKFGFNPSRPEFIAVYRYLATHNGSLNYNEGCKYVRRRFPHFNYFKLRLIIDIFIEKTLLSGVGGQLDNVTYKLNNKIKINLNDSELLKRLQQAAATAKTNR